jgi:hypothetical protein
MTMTMTMMTMAAVRAGPVHRAVRRPPPWGQMVPHRAD